MSENKKFLIISVKPKSEVPGPKSKNSILSEYATNEILYASTTVDRRYASKYTQT